MKIEVVAQDFGKASEYLRGRIGVTGRAIYHKVNRVKVWHGDVIDVSSDRGSLRNVYSVIVEDQLVVQNNVQYVA